MEVYGHKKNQSILAHQKLVSRAMAKQFLRRLVDQSQCKLRDQGFFREDLVV
jgi:hypothetical protein